MCQLLEAREWFLLRINGSHHIYGKPGHIELVFVPVHGQKSLKHGLQKHIMKIAGMIDSDLITAALYAFGSLRIA
jgi:predicted RNA binding protein YcfA (HicA-like mRNA interferase family)